MKIAVSFGLALAIAAAGLFIVQNSESTDKE